MGPEMHTFWVLYTCSKELRTFVYESTEVTDKVNIEGTNTVWTQSLPKGRGMHCHGRTSRWAPPITRIMNGRQVEHLIWTSVGLLVVENMHFWTNVCLFFRLWYVLPPLTILDTFVFSHCEQVCRSQNVYICEPMFIGLFSCFAGYYHLSKQF